MAILLLAERCKDHRREIPKKVRSVTKRKRQGSLESQRDLS